MICDGECRVGCALVIYENGQQIDNHIFRLCDNSTVFKAELWAILQAFIFIRANNIEDTVTIYSDSLSGLQALDRPRDFDYITTMVKEQYAKNINLRWIKAHAGHQGNEEADRYAKTACLLPTIDIVNLPSKSTVRRKYRDENLIEWQRRWDEGSEQGRHTHGLIRKVNPNIHISNFYLNQFLTNHGTQREYQLQTRFTHSWQQLLLGNGGYQQDTAPCHKGRIVEEHSSDFQVMSWPPNSSDLNPIEHLWSYLENQIRAATLPPRNVRELLDQLVSARYQKPQTTYQHLVESMPRRVLAVLRAKGGPTCY
ncbi:uncharacterized protein [Parasteatoda tepidariorum]|uniref:uncharacterized protein n=1 Tax=Parasteatoda tepidariorum TaxID=114398 RepID=UPI0039BC7CAB